MPIYPYSCPACNHQFEVIRKSSDEGNELCPECSQRLTIEDRTVGKTTFKLDGSGWFSEGYETKQNKYQWQD